MREPIDINREKNKMLVVKVKTKQKTPIELKVSDAYTPDSVYSLIQGPVNGDRTFYARMPHTPDKLVYQVYNPRNGDVPKDNSFQVISHKIVSLPTFPDVYASRNKIVKSAVQFIQDFSERASKYSAGGSVYRSPDGVFRIDYLDVIIDTEPEIPLSREQPNIMVPNPNYGKELTTPARISQDRGVIQVSKKYFLALTIPDRVAILLHEVSHFYINRDPYSEIEADLNALAIFLGLGYGYSDGANAFLKVFMNSQTDQNVERMNILLKFIEDFEKRYNTYR